ncbi:MAG TPA: hypothetical protein VFZ98_06220, partial [Vicinamibacterales bacterium]
MTLPRQMWVALAAALLLSAPAAAQQRPLVTQDPEVVGPGNVLIEGGIDYGRDIFYPLTGLTGNRWRIPTVGICVGLGSIVEVQLDGGPYDRLTITKRVEAPLSHEVTATGTTTHDVDDLVFATKIRIVPETPSRPAFGVRFWTRLPNASQESGLGLNTTDFHGDFLAGKTVQSVRIVGNIGLGILSDPTNGTNQNDVLDYGVSLARAVREGVEVVGEINGQWSTRSGTPPPGLESRGAMRIGGRLTRGTVRIDAGAILGLTSRDPSIGFTVG